MSLEIHRKLFVGIAVLLAVVTSQAHADRPNVVVIISDDQAWTDFGFMGHREIRTPNLDRLASESACFAQGYVPSSLCRPSLASILTGLYPHQHQIVGNDPSKEIDRAELLRHVRRLPTLPKWLASAGYVSFQSGKWWEGAPADGGFTSAMTHGDPKRGGRHGDVGLKIGREGMQPIFDFIDSTKGQPFFVWYAPMMPHQPHTPPARLLSKYERADKSKFIAKYEAMCEWFDETCGELLHFLDDRKLSENTIVVFVTDNGWIQNPTADQFAPKSKRSPYDGGLRTPILVRWPGQIPAKRIEAPVSSIDIVPTILAATGVQPTEPLPGQDLRKIAAGQSTRDIIFGEIFEHDVTDLDRPEASLLYRWCRQGNWKLIAPHKPDQPTELYDLSVDPREESNLASQQIEIVARLKQRINEWWPVTP